MYNHLLTKQRAAAGSFASLFLLAAIFLMPYSNAALEDGLIHYYGLEDKSDNVGSVDLTGTSPTYTTGSCVHGGCYTFDGNDYWSIAAGNSMFVTEGFTFCGWFNYQSSAGQVHRIVSQQTTGTVNDNLELTIRDAGTFELLTYEAGIGTTLQKTGYTANAWQFDCFVNRDAATDTRVVSRNDNQATTDTNTDTRQTVDSAQINIGTRNPVGDYYVGKMDELMIWNRGLSDDEIDTLYNGGTGLFYNETLGSFDYGTPTDFNVTLVYPANKTHYNTWNGSITISTLPNTNTACSIDDAVNFTLSSSSNGIHKFSYGAPANYNYSLTVNCSQYSLIPDDLYFWFVYDTLKPVMQKFTIANNTYISKNTTPSVWLNYTVYDKYIFRTNITVLHVPSHTIKVQSNSSNYSGVTSISMSGLLNVASWDLGQYKVKVQAVDTHTAAKFKETPKEKVTLQGTKKTTTYKLKTGDFNFTMDQDLGLSSQKDYDRITQKFDTKKFKDRAEYTIAADNLIYLPWSEYPCHFIVDNKYWYDCVGLEEPLVSEVKRGKSYKIQFRTKGKDSITTHSLGGLNELNYTSYFYINEAGPPVTTFNIYVRDTATAQLILQNVSLTLSNLNYTLITTITNGIYSNSSIPSGTYSAVLKSPGYVPATYGVNIAYNSTTTLNAYLTNSSTYVIFTIQDADTGRALEGATISISGIINGSMSLLSSSLSDITGRLRYYYIPLQPYQFVVSLSDYQTKSFTLNPIIFDSYYINLQRSASSSDTGALTGLSLEIQPQNFAVSNQNATILLSSPDGALESYSFNYSWPGNYSYYSGVNSYGAVATMPVNIASATIGDTVDLKIRFKRIGRAAVTLKYSYLIAGTSPTSGTLEGNKNKTYGLGLIERLLIISFALLIIAGAAAYFAGGAAAVVVALLMLGYFAMIGFISGWLVVVPILAGLFMIMGRSE